jgi:hypothetical protein
MLYRLALDMVYIYVISPVFSYQRFIYQPIKEAIIFSWIILIVFSVLILPFLKMKEIVIPFAMVMLFLVRFVPLTSFIGCSGQGIDFVATICLYWLLIIVAMRIPLHLPILQPPRSAGFIINSVTLLFVVVVLFVSGYYAHFRLNFNLFDIYDVRLEARQFNMPTILSYLRSATVNVLPILFLYNAKRSKWILVILITLVAFLNFSIDGRKAILFRFILCLYIYYFLAIKLKIVLKIVWLLILLCMLTLFEWYIFESNMLANMVIRRAFFMTSLLDSLYFDYIVHNGPTYYNRITSIAFQIGSDYFGASEMRSNNGLFSDAFMNLGYLGCVIYPFIYVIFFRLCEAAFCGVNTKIVFFATFLIIFTIGSSELSTSMLTHGVLLLCIVVYLMPRERRKVIFERNVI